MLDRNLSDLKGNLSDLERQPEGIPRLALCQQQPSLGSATKSTSASDTNGC